MHRRKSFIRREFPSDRDGLQSVRDGIKANSNVKLYVPFKGQNNATSAKDYSKGAHPLTFNGGAKISTAQSYYNGGSSLYLDGDGDYISLNSSSDYAFGTGLFTIKFKLWCSQNPPANPDNLYCVYGYIQDSVFANSLVVFINSSGNIMLWSDGAIATGTVVVTDSKWHDIVITRSGTGTNQCVIFTDGILDAIGTLSNDINVSNPPSIGAQAYSISSPPAREFIGYLQDFMIIKGEAWNTHKFYDATLDAVLPYATNAWKLGSYSVYDCIGSNHLTNSGVTFTTEGLQGYLCGSFNGSSSMSGTLSTPLGAGDFTVSYFAKYNSLYDYESNISLSPRNGHDFNTGTDSAGKAVLYVNGLGRVLESVAGVFTTGVWYHVLYRRIGTDLKVYINNVVVASAINSSDFSNTSFYISSLDASHENINGYMQDILFLSGYGMSDTEISLLYNSGKAKLLQLERKEHKQYFNDAYLNSYSKYLVASWGLDEKSGIRYDSAGHNHLTSNGAVGYSSDGVHGNVAGFSGSNWLSLGDVLEVNDSYTINVWLKADAITSDQGLINKNSTNEYISTILRNTGTLKFEIYDGVNNPNVVASGAIPDTNWHMVTFIRNKGNWLRVYVDASQVGSDATDTAGDCSNAGGWEIARRNGSDYFAGKMSKIQIYNGVVLDATAIAQLYNSGKGIKPEFQHIIDSNNDGDIVPWNI